MTARGDSLGGRLPRPLPWQRNVTFGILGGSIVIGWLATAVFATLVDRHPLLLIAMNPSSKYLVLTVNQLDLWSYYPVAALRLMVTKPLMWLVGGWYGERAVAYAARRSERSAQVLRWLEAQFDRLGWLIVPITSNNAVCLLAGSTGFPLVPFLLLALLGTMVRLVLYDAFGAAFRDPIDRIVSVIADNRIAIVVVCTVAVVAVVWWQHRRGTSPFDAFARLDREADRLDDADREDDR